MEVLKVRYTRPDHCTVPGGIILRKRINGDRVEYIAHHFAREKGSKTPTSFFWGRYIFDDKQKALDAFNEKVQRHARYTAGGSLIEEHMVDQELREELEKIDG